MDTVIEPLILDLVDWVIQQERTCQQLMDVWRMRRARLRIWQEANRRGLIMTDIVNGHCVVKPTSLGLILAELRRETRRQARQSRSS
jgi:hypothetical protein